MTPAVLARLTDTQPGPDDCPPPTPVLRSECAWCGVLLRDGALPISHGICARCDAVCFPA